MIRERIFFSFWLRMGKLPLYPFCSSMGITLSCKTNSLHSYLFIVLLHDYYHSLYPVKLTLCRADPEAVTEENQDTPLHCAWLNHHEATMSMLAEVSAAVPMEIKQTLSGIKAAE